MPRILQGLPGLEDHRDGQEGMAGGTEPGDQYAATMETEYPVAQETGQGRDPGKEVRVVTDREKVIKGLEICSDCGFCESIKKFDLRCPYRNNDGKGCDRSQLLMDALSMLKEQEVVRWIPVTERFPKSMINRVLVYVQHEDLTGYIGFGHFEKFKGEEMWYDLENNCQFSKRGYTVTHWMETPMPPMEGR